MKNILVSIIIPIYNGEKYIEKCLQSIINQSHNYLDIIAVNDGSTDNSRTILDKLASNENRLTVVHKKNAGVSNARNKGIEIAKGDYIQFVDVDDYIELDMVDTLLQNASNSLTDLVVCGHNRTLTSKDKTITIQSNQFPIIKLSKDDILKDFHEYFDAKYFYYVWDKLFDAKIIKKHNIIFRENVGWGEDIIFNFDYLNVCQTIFLNTTPLYNHIELNEGSITANYNPSLFAYQTEVYSIMKLFLINNNSFYNDNRSAYERKHFRAMMMCVDNLFHKNAKINYKSRKNQIKLIINSIEEQDYLNSLGVQEFYFKIMKILINRQSVFLIILYHKLAKIAERLIKK